MAEDPDIFLRIFWYLLDNETARTNKRILEILVDLPFWEWKNNKRVKEIWIEAKNLLEALEDDS